VYSLQDLGWSPFFQQQIAGEADGLFPARVSGHAHGIYRLVCERPRSAGELTATIAGRLAFELDRGATVPAVGDWVMARAASDGQGVIERVLDRRTKLFRIAAGERTEEQVLAANVDVVFVVTSMTQEFNPRRIERYLTQIWESGARPVVVVNKADLAESQNEFLLQLEDVAPEALVTSAAIGSGIDRLRAQLGARETSVFVGSSGVGKSSLINCLLGEEVQAVREIRTDDARGRHTTTRRELIVLPGGGMIIDTPGLREIQVLGDHSSLAQTFADVSRYAMECAFRDCRHVSEPGCAVLAAIDDGLLDDVRLKSFRKLQREMEFAERRTDRAAQIENKRKWKQIHKQNRKRMKERDKWR
jgi:ribosome biogenesis GTPase